MVTSTQISTGNWAYWTPQVSQGGTHVHNIRSSLNRGNWNSATQYAKVASSHDTIPNNYPQVGEYFCSCYFSCREFCLFFLNSGTISLRPLGSRWVFDNVNPLSTMISSPGCKSDKIPDLQVIALSAIGPGYADKTKLMYPSGVHPKSTFTVLRPL